MTMGDLISTPGQLAVYGPPKLRVRTTDSLAQIASVTLPPSLYPGAGLVYAGGDAVAYIGPNSLGIKNVRVPSVTTNVTIIHAQAIASGTGDDTVSLPGTGGAGGAAGTDPCPGCTFQALPLAGKGMVLSPTGSAIYVASGAGAASYPNSIISVSATTGAVLGTVPVGNDPGPMAISDDGTTLWVGLDGESSIQKVNVGTVMSAGAKYPLPGGGGATSLAMLPGSTSALAVAVQTTTSSVVVLDDGVPRPVSVSPAVGAAKVLARGPGATFYGFSGSDFCVLTTSSTGVTQMNFPSMIARSNFARSISVDGNLVYISDGSVTDVSNPAAPVIAGRFDFLKGVMAVPRANRVLVLDDQGGAAGTPLWLFDTTTFAPAGQAMVPASIVSTLPRLTQMLYLGGDGVAVLASTPSSNDQRLFIMHAPLI